MGLHHVAVATRDMEATHRFYSEVMGFELAKAEAAATPDGGWAKHLFYDTGGGGMIAFWELHDDAIGDFDPAISEGLGLPSWVNHLAFTAADEDDLAVCKRRMLDAGETVTEIDHGWCRSVYATDPNGILVEFCADTRELTEDDRREARERLHDPDPELDPPPTVEFHVPS